MLTLRQKTYLSFQLLFLSVPAYTSFNIKTPVQEVKFLLMAIVTFGLLSSLNLIRKVEMARVIEMLRLFLSFLILISISKYLNISTNQQVLLFFDMLITIYFFNKVFSYKKYKIKVNPHE